MKYTVLLLRPDYVADQYGEDTHLAHVTAGSVRKAVAAAQAEAAAIGDLDADVGGDPEDYAVLAVFQGHLDDLYKH